MGEYKTHLSRLVSVKHTSEIDYCIHDAAISTMTASQISLIGQYNKEEVDKMIFVPCDILSSKSIGFCFAK